MNDSNIKSNLTFVFHSSFLKNRKNYLENQNNVDCDSLVFPLKWRLRRGRNSFFFSLSFFLTFSSVFQSLVVFYCNILVSCDSNLLDQDNDRTSKDESERTRWAVPRTRGRTKGWTTSWNMTNDLRRSLVLVLCSPLVRVPTLWRSLELLAVQSISILFLYCIQRPWSCCFSWSTSVLCDSNLAVCAVKHQRQRKRQIVENDRTPMTYYCNEQLKCFGFGSASLPWVSLRSCLISILCSTNMRLISLSTV